MSAEYRRLEQLLHKIPRPWSVVDPYSSERQPQELEGSDARVQEAMFLVRELLPVLASVPEFDHKSVAPLHPSAAEGGDNGWSPVIRLIRKRFGTVDRFDRAVVREILAQHTEAPERFLDTACDWFLYVELESILCDALAFIQKQRIGQRACTEAPELVALAEKHWRNVSLEVQFDLVNVPAAVAGVAAFKMLDEIIDSDDAPPRLKAEAERLKIFVADQDNPVPGRDLMV